MYEKTYPKKRFEKTLGFLNKHISKDARILDLGVPNPLSKLMLVQGFNVSNTQGEDLDEDQSVLKQPTYDVLTAFEIFEHLLNPRSEEHTSELQSRPHLVCRLLLEKKNKKN